MYEYIIQLYNLIIIGQLPSDESAEISVFLANNGQRNGQHISFNQVIQQFGMVFIISLKSDSCTLYLSQEKSIKSKDSTNIIQNIKLQYNIIFQLLSNISNLNKILYQFIKLGQKQSDQISEPLSVLNHRHAEYIICNSSFWFSYCSYFNIIQYNL